jgi:hypothetical protein
VSGTRDELVIGRSGTRIEREYDELVARLTRVSRADVRFDARAYEPGAVARARWLWRDRMVNEYTSTTVFSALAAQLVEANATLDTTAVALRMAQDELRHAEICGEVVTALGGAARGPRADGVTPIARHPGCSPEERALRNVIFCTCLSEMNSVAYFIAALDVMTDPYLRDVIRQLLSDEVLHGQFGFSYLEAWSPWLDAHPDVRGSVARYLRYAFAVVEREFARGERGADVPTKDDLALGVIGPGLSGEVFRQTMEAAVVPGLARFGIDAEMAWRGRSLG